MYGLPKIHDPPLGLSVKNSIDFVNKIKDLRITRNDLMVSFDVKSLFPSIPINQALVLLKKWLLSYKISVEKCAMKWIELAKICVDQNIFQFNRKFIRQNEDTAKGNSLSGFLAEVFMSAFELELKEHPLFPRVWYRYMWTMFFLFALPEKLMQH